MQEVAETQCKAGATSRSALQRGSGRLSGLGCHPEPAVWGRGSADHPPELPAPRSGGSLGKDARDRRGFAAQEPGRGRVGDAKAGGGGGRSQSRPELGGWRPPPLLPEPCQGGSSS